MVGDSGVVTADARFALIRPTAECSGITPPLPYPAASAVTQIDRLK